MDHPPIIVQLAAGQLALEITSFLGSKDFLAAEDVLMGLSILRHFRIDFNTLLGTHPAQLDEVSFASLRYLASDSLYTTAYDMIARA